MVLILRNLWHLFAGKKSTSSFTSSLRYCKDTENLLFWVLWTLDMSGYAHPNWYYKLVVNFCRYLQAKNQLHPSCFSGDIAKICKLILGTLGMPGYTHPKWYYQLDTINFICLPKIYFIIHFFLEIWHFKESCNLIG